MEDNNKYTENDGNENKNGESKAEVAQTIEVEVVPAEDIGRKGSDEFVGEAIEMFKPINKKLIYILTVVLALLIAGLIVVIRPIYNNSSALGKTFGSAKGILVGTANGLTTGIAEGKADGKEQGLSAEDTTVEVANKMESTGNLEVLIAYGQCADPFELGTDYQALFVYKTKAVFSVDLTDIDVAEENGELIVTVPEPVCTVSIDPIESEKMAEWQRHFWSGDTSDTYTAYMNSISKISEKADDAMEIQYMDQAKGTAQKTIKQIANSASGGRFENIEVVFENEGE